MSGMAWFSKCGAYRYGLLRHIDLGMDGLDGKQERRLNIVMLNPSIADAVQNDPTVTRCMGYARRWGYGMLIVTNLFAFRATDPRHLKYAADPVGPENDAYIGAIAADADLILLAWGSHGGLHGRNVAVLDLLRGVGKPLHCLATSKDGHPKHPLYLRADLQPVAYVPAAADSPDQGEGAALKPKGGHSDVTAPSKPGQATSEWGAGTNVKGSILSVGVPGSMGIGSPGTRPRPTSNERRKAAQV